MDRSQKPTGTTATNQPKVSLFTATCVLVSNVIGGGIFTTTGFLARDLGDPALILLLWAGGGLLALAGAMSYSELGTALPRAGGDYVYLREAYGPLMGFLSGWTSFTVGFGAAIAASSVSFATYFLRAGPIPDDSGLITTMVALSLLWSLTAVHAAGVGAGGRLQQVLTTTKIAAIFMLIAGGLMLGHGTWNNLTVYAPNAATGAGPAVTGFIFVMYTYLGWNVAGYIAGEIADPARTLPRVMIGGIVFVIGVYLLLNLVYLYALPVTVLGVPPVLPVAEKAAAALWGPGAGRFVALILSLSITGAVSAMVWAGPRVYWAMARDGVFAPFFAVSSPAGGAPVRALLLQSIWASVLILTGTFEQLILYSGLVLTFFSALTITSIFVLRRRQPDLPRPFRVPFYPVVPALFITAAVIIVAESLFHRPIESALGVATVLAGVPFYLFWRRPAN